MGNESNWEDPAKVAQLVRLWDARVPLPVMVEVLKVSKSAICGKVGRLGLQRRDSPIKPRKLDNVTGNRKRRKAMRVPPVLPPLSSEHEVAIAEIVAAVTKTIVVKPKPLPPPPAPVFVGRIRECCWPMSNVGRKWFFCEAPTLPGKDYCQPHHAIGFYKPRVRGEIGGGRSEAQADAS